MRWLRGRRANIHEETTADWAFFHSTIDMFLAEDTSDKKRNFVMHVRRAWRVQASCYEILNSQEGPKISNTNLRINIQYENQ